MIDVVAGAARVRERVGGEPFAAALVLGSGLGALAEAVDGAASVPFTAVEGLPGAGVVGHEGRWVAGELEGRRVLVQAGRYHLYEGLPMEVVCAPVRVAAALGAPVLIVTNAVGGVRRTLRPGALVLLEDQINLTGHSPLAGPPRAGEPRFLDMSEPYDRELRALARRCAERLGVELETGVYGGVAGPSYETPAEIRMLERIGADVVGMSTVAEVIAARSAGLRCLGLSLVTNHAAGVGSTPLRHEDVVEVGRRSAATLERLVRAVLRELPA